MECTLIGMLNIITRLEKRVAQLEQELKELKELREIEEECKSVLNVVGRNWDSASLNNVTYSC